MVDKMTNYIDKNVKEDKNLVQRWDINMQEYRIKIYGKWDNVRK